MNSFISDAPSPRELRTPEIKITFLGLSLTATAISLSSRSGTQRFAVIPPPTTSGLAYEA